MFTIMHGPLQPKLPWKPIKPKRSKLHCVLYFSEQFILLESAINGRELIAAWTADDPPCSVAAVCIPWEKSVIDVAGRKDVLRGLVLAFL